MLLEVIKDELIKAIRIGARARDYISFKYTIKVFHHFNDRRALDEVIKIVVL
jgi:hypothetical protein